MSIYDRARATTDRLLNPNRLGAVQGAVTLSRHTLTPGANAWDDPTVVTSTETLLAQVFGVSSEFVGTPANEPVGGVILASDLMCITAVPAMGLQPGDTVAVNGVPVAVLRIMRIPAAGTVAAYRVIIRGGATEAGIIGGTPGPAPGGDDW